MALWNLIADTIKVFQGYINLSLLKRLERTCGISHAHGED